jgi:hypothetical protein
VVARTVRNFDGLHLPWLIATIANGHDLRGFMYAPGYGPI